MPTRRRGAQLEEIILTTAWSILTCVGYQDFRVDAVATGAGTSKPVIYRRWPSKVALAASAVVHYLKTNPIVVPDLGSLRDELALLLRRYADRIPPNTIRLFFEMGEDMVSMNDSFTDVRFHENLLDDLIRRAGERGELGDYTLSPYAASVPLKLVLAEMIVTGRKVPDTVISQIVDEVFLPMVGQRRVRSV